MSTQRLKIEQIQEYDFTDLLKIYQQKENMKYILSGKYDYKMLEIKEKWNLINCESWEWTFILERKIELV